jgi:cytochrome c oxidase subunit 4
LAIVKENTASVDDKKTHGIGLRAYLTVWALLITLTAVTVTMAKLRLGGLTIIAVLSIAIVKSLLVLLYFMHLRHENRLIIKLLIPGTIVLLAIFIALTYTDVMTR